MHSSYHAEIINLSQLDKSIFKEISVIEVRKRFLGLVKIYTMIVPATELKRVVARVQANMSHALKKEWYVTFHNAEKVIIVFRQKTFELSSGGIKPEYQQLLKTDHAVDKQSWDEMIHYAKSLGIPDSQCDFLPPDFAERAY